MKIEQEVLNKGAVIAPEGELDASTVPAVRRVFEQVLEARPARVVMDLSGITFLDSTGVGLLAFCHRKLKQHNATLVLAAAHDQPLETLTMLHFSKVVNICDTRENALNAD